MNLLLDTHVFLWFISADPRLPEQWQEEIRNPANAVYLSVASSWECIIKHQLGKLPLPETPDIYIPRQREKHLIAALVIDEASLVPLVNLPLHHRDPFDRLLISQALAHDLTFVSADPIIKSYSVSLLPTS